MPRFVPKLFHALACAVPYALHDTICIQYTNAGPPSFVTGCSAISALPPKLPARSVIPESSYLSPPASPSIPDTLEASHSTTTSSTYSTSPLTPLGQVDNEMCIASPDNMPIASEHRHHSLSKPMRSQSHLQLSSRTLKDSAFLLRNPRCNLFAYAAPVICSTTSSSDVSLLSTERSPPTASRS